MRFKNAGNAVSADNAMNAKRAAIFVMTDHFTHCQRCGSAGASPSYACGLIVLLRSRRSRRQ